MRAPPSSEPRACRWPAGRALALLAGSLLAAAPAAAGTLAVLADAAFSGGFGLRATLVDSCISPDDLTVDAPATIAGSFTACDNLTVEGVQVVAPGATLQAGQSIVLGNGFSTAPGAPLAAFNEPPLSPFAFVTDDTPAAATTYRAEYRLDLDGLTIGDGDEIANLVGSSADGTEHFRVILSRNAMLGENRVFVRAREDDGTTSDGLELDLPAGWNLIEVKWAAGVGTGSLVLSRNGSTFAGLVDLDNDQARINRVRWGAVAGAAAASAGSLDLDDFESGI